MILQDIAYTGKKTGNTAGLYRYCIHRDTAYTEILHTQRYCIHRDTAYTEIV